MNVLRRLGCLALAAVLVATVASPAHSQVPLDDAVMEVPIVAPEQPVRFEHLTLEDGLSQGNVYAILQDRRGFLWFGTDDGLNRYDGYTITVYKPVPFEAASLSGPRIYALHEDRAGRLWVGTDKGLNFLDPATGRFTRYPHGHASAPTEGLIHAIIEGATGVLWIATSLGLTRLDVETGQHTRFVHDPNDDRSLSDTHVFSLHRQPDGTLWVGTSNGLNRWNPETETFTRHLYDPEATALRYNPGRVTERGAARTDVSHIVADPADPNVLWLAGWGLMRFDTRTGALHRSLPDRAQVSAPYLVFLAPDPVRKGVFWTTVFEQGLLRFDVTERRFTYYQHDPHAPTSISSNDLWHIHVDRSHVIWVGDRDGKGLSRFGTNVGAFRHYRHQPRNPHSLSNDLISSITEDHTGALWVGTYQGGLNRYDRRTHRFTRFRHDPQDASSLGSDDVRCVLDDHTGTLWVCVDGQGIDRWDRSTGQFVHYRADPADSTTLSSDYVSSAYEDPSGTLWFGTAEGVLHRFERATHTFTRFPLVPADTSDFQDLYWKSSIRALYASEQEPGVLWVGTYGSGLIRFEPSTGAITHYKHDPTDPRSLSNDVIQAIHASEHEPGVLWISTYGGGLNRFDSRTETFMHVTTADGLPDNTVYAALEDARGRLWLSTNNGLARYDPATGAVRTFDVSDGLQGREYNNRAFFESASGEMFFGGTRGLNAFFPDRIAGNPIPPEVAVTGITRPARSGETVSLASPLAGPTALHLAHDENDLTFAFAALHYAHPVENQYAYRLEPYDDAWHQGGTRRTATYTNLDPGDYVFRVKAANSDGVWNEEGAAVRVVIRPPWWQTSWATVVFGVLAAVAVAGLVRWRTRVLEQRKHELEHLVAERTAEVEAQRRQLVELDAMKSRFFANISHEFRTPLTLILGPLRDLLVERAGPLDEPLARQHRMMYRNGQRLLRLINQLLDLAKLEAGGMHLRARRMDLVPFLRGLVAAFGSRAERQGISLQLDVSHAPLLLHADPDKLEKIIFNLLSNAFTFTPDGGTIRVALARSDDGWGALSIEDTGPGIPENELPHIFDRFQQGSTAVAHAHEGTGIGLALVKELTALHGGTVGVESQVGVGTCFTVRLPVEREGLPSAFDPQPNGEGHEVSVEIDSGEIDSGEIDRGLDGSEAAAPEPRKPKAATVLVIEDNPDMRTYLRRHLAGDYQVVEATDGDDGLAQARALEPDLIISDVMMPGLYGYALCRALKTDAALSHIPVVLLTAKAEEESKIEGLETGADAYLYKPFNAEELLIRAENLIQVRRLLRERYSGEVMLTPSDVTVPSADAVWVEQVRDVVERHIGNSNFGVDWLADELDLSTRQLQRRLKDLTDLSPGGFIRTMRLERAAQLLEQHYGGVAEVAEAVGYRDAKHFSQLFRQVFGVVPSSYPDDVA
ncbi:MAG: response regulator [Bacteroidetes bacterium]|jgi:signal transduction histidine kinase/ligand-binding sensor domain-containing protein/DNA-binding response OmpR family regulator|nr:response regulator [Bacteroidota bacterium]